MVRFYNTLTRRVDSLQPIHPPDVTMYTCGPTVYDYPHIGNWFAFIRWDILARTLRTSGYNVQWVMNITDVGHLVSDADEGEDKLEKGAKRDHKSAWQVADYYGSYFIQGLQRLQFSEITHIPKATDHITEQIALVQTLEKKGFTYIIEDGVYFDTSKLPDYGKLAQLHIEALKAGARVELNAHKKNPSDFALWKFSPRNSTRDMQWWAPWKRPGQESDAQNGELHPLGYCDSKHQHVGNETLVDGSWGFPGWHIECSAMSMKYLGKTIDIHCGGIDHVPVHHTNEIAQSESANNAPFAHIWIHSNFIKINGSKISKSLGNIITLEDIEKHGYPLQSLRLLVLESHYRSEAQFSWEVLEAANNRLQHWQTVANLRWQPIGEKIAQERFTHTKEVITQALQNDLETPKALQTIDAFFNEIEKTLCDEQSCELLTEFLQFLRDIVGIDLLAPDIAEEQKEHIAKRYMLRQAKEWNKADAIRDELGEMGIIINDSPIGQIWDRK